MELEFWASTDVGRVRDHNEDNFLVDKRMKLFVVCDGMGGHAAGEVASAICVRVVREVIAEHRDVFERLSSDPDDRAHRKSVLSLMEHAIKEACARIYQQAVEDPSKRGMGTTCSALLLAEGRGFIGHVGDSRVYLFRGEKVHQVTDDHSLMNEMLRLGKIKPGEEHNLPHRNAVTRAVGVNEQVEVDTLEVDVQAGDAFLLCSDGLSGYFKNDDHIIDLMELEDPKTIAEQSISFANAGGGKDNITSIVVRITGDDSQRRDVQRTIEVLERAPYFQYLAYKEMVQIVNLSARHELDPGQVIFAEGTDPGCLFFVAEGKVRLDRGGRTIATMLPSDHFAETAIIDETPQTFGATAIDQTVLIAFQRDRFMELLRQEPNLAVKLLWNFLQTFAFRMRAVPYEALLGDRAQRLDENTPPSGTLVFDEDRRTEESEAASPPEAKPDAGRDGVPEDAAVTLGAQSDPDATIDNSRFGGAIKDTIPAGTSPRDDLGLDDFHTDGEDEDLESLRETMQMDREVDDRARTHNALPHVTRASKPAPVAAKPRETKSAAIGKAISGESVVKASTPQAQVLKRTKLVVGEGEFGNSEQTRDIPALPPEKKREADSTLELDLADDNIEEVN